MEPGMGGLPGDDQPVNGLAVASGVVSTAAAAVNFFKPARAWLDSIWF